MTGGDRSVRREEQTGRSSEAGLGERQTVVNHDLANPFQSREAGMALVEVGYFGLVAERREHPHPPDPENQLLLDTRLLVASVEPRGYVTVATAVLSEVGVEQVEPVASY